MATGAPVFVAEVSSNHARDLDRCLEFVDTAAEIGCAAVKFQLFRVNQLFAPEILAVSEAHRAREAWELPTEHLQPIASRCAARGIGLFCTPFYLEAVVRLFPLVDSYKIASYELIWDELLRACGQTEKPVVLSTGMATMEEIAHAVETLRSAGCDDLTLLHCVSGYPTPAAECNLAAIETLRESFGCRTGWSDHSVAPGVIERAVHKWGAEMVEFHLDLDGTGAEYASGHCWLPDEIGPVIREIKAGLSADGTGVKEPSPLELPDRDWRADPSDGLRPMRWVRPTWRQ